VNTGSHHSEPYGKRRVERIIEKGGLSDKGRANES